MGTIPATTKTHGPFRKVVEIAERVETLTRFGRPREQRVVYEVLECGHRGETLEVDVHAGTPSWKQAAITEARDKVARGKARRRCAACRVPTCDWCGKEPTADNPLSTQLRTIHGTKRDGAHAACRAEEDAFWETTS